MSLISVLRFSAIYLCILSVSVASAKDGKGASKSALNPEALSAKALLEELLARRYSQGLASLVDRQSFNLGAELELVEVPPTVVKPVEAAAQPTEPQVISDLMLGSLDPEELIKKYTPPGEEHAVAKGLLSGFRIRQVRITAGLRESLGADTKAQVDKWLSARVSGEFGKAGKSEVAFIKMPAEKPVAPKSLLENLSQFQSLLGQAVTALALILAVLLWQLMAKPKNVASDAEHNVRIAGGAAQAADKASAEAEREKVVRAERDNATAVTDIATLTAGLRQLSPSLNGELEEIIRSWCQLGESGKLRLACFAEAVGRDFGRLPIPADAVSDVSKMFSKMPELDPKLKRDSLQKAYWDVLSALNLGAESLSQPFGYLNGLNLDLINQILMDQNPKMKTLVSLYMPEGLRGDYVRTLSPEGKLELLRSAAELSEIPAAELKALDGTLAGKLRGQNSKEVVGLGLTLQKVVAALSPSEEIQLLRKMEPAQLVAFRRVVPSLAFLGEWASEPLAVLLSRTMADELVAFLRICPDLQTRLLDLSPAMTAEMTRDELALPDRAKASDRDRALLLFANRLREMVRTQEIRLEEVFPIGHDDKQDAAATVTPIRKSA